MNDVRPNIYFQECVLNGETQSDVVKEAVISLIGDWKFSSYKTEENEKFLYYVPSVGKLQKYILILNNLNNTRTELGRFIFRGYSVCFILPPTIGKKDVERFSEIIELPMYFIVNKKEESVTNVIDSLFEKFGETLEHVYVPQSYEAYNSLYDKLYFRLDVRLDDNYIRRIRELKMNEGETIEIEWRFGYPVGNSSFVGSVSGKDWEEFKSMIDKRKVFKSLGDPIESVVSRYNYNGESIREVKTGNKTLIYKKIQMLPPYDVRTNTGTNLMLRLAVNKEITLSSFEKKAKLSRTEKRRRYVYQYKNEYQIHLSRIEIGKDVEWQIEAEQLDKGNPNRMLEYLYLLVMKQKPSSKNVGNSLKKISKQVIPFSKDVRIQIRDFMISPKLDGVRTLLYYDNGYLSSINEHAYKFVIHTDEKIGLSIFDSEEYEGIFYVFDVLWLDGKSLLEESYEERISRLKEIRRFNTSLVQEKRIVSLEKGDLKEKIMKAVEYDGKRTDGFVLTKRNANYDDSEIYKYKPPEHLTIDFLIREKDGKYLLFVGMSEGDRKRRGLSFPKWYSSLFREIGDYFPFPFFTKDNSEMYVWKDADERKLDNTIGEFRWNGREFELVRERTDRLKDLKSGDYFGNNVKIALDVWDSIINPLSLDDVITMFLDDSYFGNQSEVNEFNRKFNSRVKLELYKRVFENAELLIDLCSGQGNDLFKFQDVSIKNVLALEKDLKAIKVMQERYDDGKKKKKLSFSLSCLQADLTDDYRNLRELIKNVVTKTMNCGFGLHYLVGSEESCRNIARFISLTLEKDGVFVATMFDGKSVFELLEKGEYVVSTTGGTKKYGIRALYDEEKFLSFGQKIEVLLPFSENEYYEEPLVNIEALARVFATESLELIETGSFSEFLELAKSDKKLSMYNPDEADKEYVSLYSYVVFRKR